MENPSAVLSMGIDDFAAAVGVSRATVFRFCKELGSAVILSAAQLLGTGTYD